MPTAFEKFSELENRIARTIELVKTTRLEKAALEKERAAAQLEIRRLERELEELRKERDLVKNKVESLLNTVSKVTEGSLA